MKSKRAAIWLLGTSLFFAGLIILCSWLIKGDSANVVTNLLIAVWWIPFSYLIAVSSRGKSCSRWCGEIKDS